MEDWRRNIEAADTPYGGDHMQAVIATKPALAQDYCTFGTIGGRLELPNAILLPLGLAQLPLLPSVQPLYDLVPNFQIDVPLRVNVPEDFGTDEIGRASCRERVCQYV